MGGELHFLEKDVYYYNEIPNLAIRDFLKGQKSLRGLMVFQTSQ